MHAQSITTEAIRSMDIERYADDENGDEWCLEDEEDALREIYAEAMWDAKHTWGGALREAIALGFTGHAAFAVATDTMSSTFKHQ